jgi:PHD/YefM family antitoxin component YafN of YafNO toxin-antitoxin module
MLQQLISMEDFASVQEAQAGITRLFTKAKNKGKFVRVMRNQEPLGVLIPNNLWESLIEDLEALSSPNYIKEIADSRKSNRSYSSDEVKEMLGYN